VVILCIVKRRSQPTCRDQGSVTIVARRQSDKESPDEAESDKPNHGVLREAYKPDQTIHVGVDVSHPTRRALKNSNHLNLGFGG
jgi:hypothetical protein